MHIPWIRPRSACPISQNPDRPPFLLLYFLFALILVFHYGCAPQIHSKIDHQRLNLSSDALASNGLAFITPSTVTGQEEEKQAVAFIFSNTLKNKRPDLKIISLPETLSAINQAGLTDAYEEMFREYKDTGVFKRDVLEKIAKATDSKYLAQLKLAGFRQGSSGRFSVFGLRLMETKRATLRLFFQIWDAEEGKIVWEALQELNWTEEMMAERVITLQTVIAQAAENISSRLPQ